MDASKLLKTLGIGQGNILAPHIDMYLQDGNFPRQWTIEIPRSAQVCAAGGQSADTGEAMRARRVGRTDGQ